MKKAVLRLSNELVREVLQMPPGVEMVDFFSVGGKDLGIVLAGDDLPDECTVDKVQEGCNYKQVDAYSLPEYLKFKV